MLLTFLFLGIGRARFWSAYAGASGLVLLLALVLQVMAPLAAFVLTWPLLVVGAMVWGLAERWDGARLRPSATVFAAALAVPALAQLIYLSHPIALAICAFGLLSLVFLDLYLRLFVPWTPRHPRP